MHTYIIDIQFSKWHSYVQCIVAVDRVVRRRVRVKSGPLVILSYQPIWTTLMIRSSQLCFLQGADPIKIIITIQDCSTNLEVTKS
jgi:hypothetical protein